MLVSLSRRYGSDADFVLAGGGNTSLKTPDRLYIKASGQSLADIDAGGFVELDRAALDALLARDLGGDVDRRERLFKEAILAARVHSGDTARPSVESVLHHLLGGRFVVHTHPWVVGSLACCVGGESLCRELLGDGALWIPFVDPGFTLARAVRLALADHASRTGVAQPALVLANHGLIVGGDTDEAVARRTEAVVAPIRRRLAAAGPEAPFGAVTAPNEAAAAIRAAVEPVLRASAGAVAFCDCEPVMEFVCGADGEASAAGGPLSPDQIVYCRSFPLWFAPAARASQRAYSAEAASAAKAGSTASQSSTGEAPDSAAERLRGALARHEADTGLAPLVVLVAGVGLAGLGETDTCAANARDLYVDAIRVMAGARRLGGIHYMTKRDRDFIENWEVELYRRQIARR